MKNEITIQKEDILQAYHQATLGQRALLENIFGKDIFQPKDVKERIKTFEDAILELGYNNQTVIDYYAIANGTTAKDILAYAKLRVIAKALNEGWQPQFIEGETRWYPWFRLWMEDELKNKSEEWKTDTNLWQVGDSSGSGAHFGFVSCYVWSGADTVISACLAVKSDDLADYFSKQFMDIWADYLFK